MHKDPDRYFDYSASALPYLSALERFKAISADYFANPSSAHNPGREAKKRLLDEKEKFCNMLNFNDGRLLLCSSGTEANNTIIEGHIKKYPGKRILLAENVHSSLWYAFEKYHGIVDILKIDVTGQIDIDNLKLSLREDTSLVCISHVCNETGAIQNPDRISNICAGRGIKLLIDGAQAVGHVPVDMEMIQCNYYSFSAHKFGAGRSFGGLLIRDDDFGSLLMGGNQEWGLRAGTENLAGLAAGVTALTESLAILEKEKIRLELLKNDLLTSLKKNIPGLFINSPATTLPGFLSAGIPGFTGSEIVSVLSLEGFFISTGSACHDNHYKPSRVILALGRTEQEAIATVRITMGRGTTKKSVTGLADALIAFTKK